MRRRVLPTKSGPLSVGTLRMFGRKRGGLKLAEFLLAMVDTLHNSRDDVPEDLSSVYQRDSPLTIWTNEGLTKTLPPHILVPSGSRVWENQIRFSGDLSNAIWTKMAGGLASPPVRVSGNTYTFATGGTGSGDFSDMKQVYASRNDGETNVLRFLVSSSVPTTFSIFVNAQSPHQNITLTSTPKLVTINHVSIGSGSNTVFMRLWGSVVGNQTVDITIEDVQIQDKSGHADTTTPDEYAPTDVVANGPDVIINGGFDTDSDWVKGAGWTISSTFAQHNGPVGDLSQASLISGKTYTVSWIQSTNISNANVEVFGGTTANSISSMSTLGLFTVAFVADGPDLIFRVDPGDGLTIIDTVIVKEITGSIGFSNRANANTINGQILTENVGELLRPLVTKTANTNKGAAVAQLYARYRPRENSTARATGDKMILAVDTVIPKSQTGNGHYYEVTTAGTTASTPPDFTGALSINDQVVDGTVTWTNMGRYIIPGWLGEQGGNNEILDAFVLTRASWTGSAATALDAQGLDGQTNWATTVTDSSTSFEQVKQTNFPVANDTKTHSITFAVRKDNDETRFPAFEFNLNGGTTIVSHVVELNTKTGAKATVLSSGGTTTSEVLETAKWWLLHMTSKNNVDGNVNANVTIAPSRSNIFGGAIEVAATGSIIVGLVHARIDDIALDSPIMNNGAIIPRDTSNRFPAYPVSEHDDADGSYIIQIINGEAIVGNPTFIGLGTPAQFGPLVQGATASFAADGTNIAVANVFSDAGKDTQIVASWNLTGDELAILADGVPDLGGGIVPYDGLFLGAGVGPIRLRAGLQKQSTYTLNFMYIKGSMNSMAREEFLGFD